MKIIIAGAGAIGFHLASLLSKENQDITLIDRNENVLIQVDRNLDVLTIHGDATSKKVLETAGAKKAHLFISVTTSESTNLLSALLAKRLGTKNTIARVSNSEHLEETNKKMFLELGIDVLISPQQLAAQEIARLVERASFTDHFEFEDGKVSIVGFTVDPSSPLIHKSIDQIDDSVHFKFRGIALLRDDRTIIPTNDTVLQQGDHLYISTQKKNLEEAKSFVGKQLKPINNIMIVGGTSLAFNAAEILEDHYSVKIVIGDEDRCKEFLQRFNKCLIINADPSDVDSLREEGLDHIDAFIALTPNTESNIITSLMAEEFGVHKTIALVENVNYTHISQNIGIDTIINKKLITANNIFRFVRKGKVAAIASLHGVGAEIIEFVVHKKNRLITLPIGDLKLPKKCIIAGIVRANQSILPTEDDYLKLDDKVIVLSLPEAIHQVEEIFK